MSNPNYVHEFVPNRRGLCKQIIDGKYCHQGPLFEKHLRCERCGLVINSVSIYGCECPSEESMPMATNSIDSMLKKLKN